MRNQIFITDRLVIRIFVNNRVRHHKVAHRVLNIREGDRKVARSHFRIVNIVSIYLRTVMDLYHAHLQWRITVRNRHGFKEWMEDRLTWLNLP